MPVDSTKTIRVVVNFPKEMVEKIDDYWHEQRFTSRNETIRHLVSKSLDKGSAK